MDTQESKPIYLIIILFIFALGVFIYIWEWSGNKKIEPKEDDAPKEFSINTDKFDASVIPQGLPEDLPIEEGATVVSNQILKISIPGGGEEEQVVRSYISAKTVQENLETYKDYVRAKNWQISGEIDVNKDLSIFLSSDPKNPGDRIKYEFTKNSITQDVTVKIILIRNI